MVIASQPKTTFRTFVGQVVSNKMKKTITVQVERIVVHPKYGKRYLRRQKYHVHDENNEYQPGEKVVFIECRPLSRSKRWRALKKKV